MNHIETNVIIQGASHFPPPMTLAAASTLELCVMAV